MNIDVPQGSILGPLFLLIYTILTIYQMPLTVHPVFLLMTPALYYDSHLCHSYKKLVQMT